MGVILVEIEGRGLHSGWNQRERKGGGMAKLTVVWFRKGCEDGNTNFGLVSTAWEATRPVISVWGMIHFGGALRDRLRRGGFHGSGSRFGGGHFAERRFSKRGALENWRRFDFGRDWSFG